MSAINTVLLGARGQLGKTIAADWLQPVAGTSIKLHGFDLPELDICQPEQLKERLADLEARVVINAAAYTQVDNAESEVEQALQVNRDGTANVAQWAAANDCRLIHISTDFVFDGRSSSVYQPEDTTSPINNYGFSKLEGELAIKRIHPEGSIIIRTSWLYSHYQPNFVTTMLRLMSERDRLRVVTDQIGTPTSTHSLANLIRSIISSGDTNGVFHWSDAGVASWYDFAVAIQEEGLANGMLESTIPIEPIKSSDYPTQAARPAFSVLDKSDSYERFDIEAVHWRSELRRVIADLKEMTDST